MANKHTHKLLIAGLFFLIPYELSAQDTIPVNYIKYPDYKSVKVSEFYNPHKYPWSRKRMAVVLPRRVDNSEKIYFPPVFNQDNGSCGSASRIGYMFTEEINAYRGTDASLPENIYPTHFTWLLTNHGPGKEGMARDNGIPNMNMYGGRTYSKLFGNQGNEDPFGWMTGYDKWYSAMFNRISETSNIGPLDQQQYANILKGWLYDHNGDPAFQGRGGVAGIGVASAATLGTISTGKNVGQKYIKYWGDQVDHALTIVGYDDDIWCDINGDGVQTSDEVGAWIIVNSWGSGWANKGLVYCPYSQAKPTRTATGYWQPELYHIRKNYRPLKALKVKMNFSHRSELSLSVGASTDMNANVPDREIPLSHFTYCGWQKVNGIKLNNVPMLGQWADGVMHTEDMEFGYDITDLVSSFDLSKPLKYFFIVNSSADATGVGKIADCSIMDYALDEKGIEIPFTQKNVTISTLGKQTVITTSLQGEPLNAPLNLTWISDTGLSWTKPQYSPYTLEGYKVYKNNNKIATLNADATSYIATDSKIGDNYVVSAFYTVNGMEVESNMSNQVNKLASATRAAISETGSINFGGYGFSIPNVFTNGMPQCTIEFWMKPAAITNWNFQMGPGWGKFLFHLNSGGGISVGYTTSNRIHNVAPVNINEWTHIAIVLDGSKITLYKNGQSVGTTIDSGNGMPALSTFLVGASGNGINGNLDEFRIWNKALTQDEILSRKDQLILHPETLPNLVAYYQMDMNSTLLKDCKGGNNASPTGTITHSATDYPLKGTINDFTLSNSSCYVGEVIEISSSTNPFNSASIQWNVPAAGIINSAVLKPSLIFNGEGTFQVSKSVTLSTGEILTATKNVVVKSLPLPEPLFAASKDTIITGERVSFENKTATPLNGYLWTMKGAETESATTVNAGATYSQVGVYSVILTANNVTGQKSFSKTIVVNSSAPKVDFETAQRYILKGETVKFVDKSLYTPYTYKWTFAGGTPQTSTVPNPTVTYTNSGKFKVKLTVANEKGESTVEKTNYVIVSNDISGNSLSFDGDNDMLTINGLFSEKSSASPFTIEWWMKPTDNKDDCQIMATDAFSITETSKGGLSIGFGADDRMTVDNGTLEKESWDHYAFTFNAGAGVFYKNGTAIATRTFTTKSVMPSSWTNGLRVGNATNSANVTIDELRIWNSARTQLELLQNLNARMLDAKSQTALEGYFRFDEAATETPQDYSSHNRSALRRNIGPEGDMWSASNAFCVPDYVEKEFIPDSNSTYIIRDLDGNRFNTGGDATWSQFRTQFATDGTMTGLCDPSKATYGLNSKYVRTGSSEFAISLNSTGSWNLKDINTDLYARVDQGFMIPSNTDYRVLFSSFHKDNFENVRICYGVGKYMKVSGNNWVSGSSLRDFSFLFEEVKPISSVTTFSEVNGSTMQQLRFNAYSRLNGTPKTLQGSVSYAMTMESGKWYPLNFAAPLEEVSFQGKIVNGDTVRLGGKMTLEADFEVRKYENGQLYAVKSFDKALPAGAYLIRLKNGMLNDKNIIFRTAMNVQFKDTPTQPRTNCLCGSDMARSTSVSGITGYYIVNSTGDKMTFVKGSLPSLAPFEAYVPYTGNVDTAFAEIDLNGEAIFISGVESEVEGKVEVMVENGYIKVTGTESLFTVYTISGTEVSALKQQSPGYYLVIVDGKAYKILVH